MKLPRRPRLPRRSQLPIDRRALRDPRLLFALVPVAAVVLLVTSSHGASTRPLAVAPTTTTTTTVPGAAGAGPDVAVAGTELVADDGHSAGFDDGGSSGSSGSSGSRSGSATRRSSGSTSPARVAGISETAPGTNPAADTTATVPPAQVPQAVVSEAASPAVMGVVGVAVAALAVNGAVLWRRRTADRDREAR